MAARRSLAVAISWVRWAGLGLSLFEAVTFDPAAYALAGLIGLYNLPAAAARRLPQRAVEPALAVGLAGDLLVAGAWLLVNAGDRYGSAFIVFMAVAIEAGVLYRWRGCALLLGVFLGALVLHVLRGSTSGVDLPLDVLLFRTAVMILVGLASAALTEEGRRLRRMASDTAGALARDQVALQEEATERQAAEKARQASDERLRAIVRSAPLMLFAMDREGVITFCDGTGFGPLGNRPRESVGWSVRELYRGDAGVLDEIRQALSGKTVSGTLEEGDRTFAVTYGPFRDAQGHVAGAIGVAVDISERRRAEAALQEQTALYETMLRAQSDLGDLVIVTEDDRLVYANRAATAISGYSRDELAAMPLFSRAAAPDGRVEHFEAQVSRKDGREVELEAAQITLTLKGRRRAFTIARDITDRKRVDAELRESFQRLRLLDEQRQALLSRLVRVQEEERKAIARDIHDDSIQAMFAVGLRLHMLQSQLKDPAQLKLLDDVERTVEKSTARLRHLLFELRPVALDEDGLAAALRLYVEDLQKDGGLEATIETRLTREPSAEARVILYRIAQEALMNVRKHSRASRVTVELDEREGGAVVSVQDNGAGFSVERGMQPVPGHLGLAAMRERAEMIGGKLHVYSTPGDGTLVECWVPFQDEGASDAA